MHWALGILFSCFFTGSSSIIHFHGVFSDMGGRTSNSPHPPCLEWRFVLDCCNMQFRGIKTAKKYTWGGCLHIYSQTRGKNGRKCDGASHTKSTTNWQHLQFLRFCVKLEVCCIISCTFPLWNRSMPIRWWEAVRGFCQEPIWWSTNASIITSRVCLVTKKLGKRISDQNFNHCKVFLLCPLCLSFPLWEKISIPFFFFPYSSALSQVILLRMVGNIDTNVALREDFDEPKFIWD